MSEQDQDQKTEDPSGKQQQKFRDEGDVAKSRDVPTLVSLFAGTAAMIIGWPLIAGGLRGFSTTILGRMDSSDELTRAMLLAGKTIVTVCAPVALAVLVFGIASEIAQIGFNWTWKPLIPKFSKLNPLPNLPRLIFSVSTMVELIKSILKVIVIGFFAVRVLFDELSASGRLAGLSVAMLLYKLGHICLKIILHVGLALVVIAIIDIVIERYRHHKKMMMTKEEVKQEHKEQEGDPLVKRRIRGRQFEVARRRMIEKVAKADVVVVNPTHYSVAIGYDMTKEAAPRILAMGMNEVAMKIREKARHSGVPVVSDPPLARGLFADGKLGAYIPPTYYRAVAALLAWVYGITGRVA
jgi:flagellar biosynthetic protein FlhB